MTVTDCPVDGCGYRTGDVDGAIGAVVLQYHLSTVHVTTPQHGAAALGTKKMDRPEAKEDMSEMEWNYFIYSWRQYKAGTGINTEAQIRRELHLCCTDTVMKRLYQLNQDNLENLSEKDTLEQVKAVAVISLDKTVHRVHITNIKQDEGETLSNFVSRLRAKAALCDYNILEGQTSYQEDIIETLMLAGLYNSDHQTRILAEPTKYPTFKEKYNALLAMQTSERSTTELSQPSTAARSRSDYANSKFDKKVEEKSTCEKCSKQFPIKLNKKGVKHTMCFNCYRQQIKSEPYAGKKTDDRQCYNCEKTGHIARDCTANKDSNGKAGAAAMGADNAWSGCFYKSTGKVLDKFQNKGKVPGKSWNSEQSQADREFYTTFRRQNNEAHRRHKNSIVRTAAAKQRREVVPNMEWVDGKFIKARPFPQPKVSVRVDVMHENMEKFGSRITVADMAKYTPCRGPALGDSGAQSCVAGPWLLEKMRYSHHYLLQTSHIIQGIGTFRPNIMGAILARITINDTVTRAIVYICEDEDGFCLSTRSSHTTSRCHRQT